MDERAQNLSQSIELEIPLSSRGEPKGPPDACLFVASLSSDSDEESLKEYFSKYGEVLKVKLLKDKKTGRPYAFVQFLNIEDSEGAISEPQNHVVDGRHLRVERAKVNRTLFIAKLSRQMVNQELREVAEEFGPVENVTIIKNHQTNKSKGCGFVKFVYREDAMDGLVGLKQKYKKWVVEWATSANDPDMLGIDKQNVFVGGLNPKVSKDMLSERFGNYGELESVTLINPNQSSKEGDDKNIERSAFAFLRYLDWQSSAVAIENENGAEWIQRRIRVQYCETPEMKHKKRFNKYINYINQSYQMPYFYAQLPYPMVPMYYNNGVSVGYDKFNPYQDVAAYPAGWGAYPLGMWNYCQPWPMVQPNFSQIPAAAATISETSKTLDDSQNLEKDDEKEESSPPHFEATTSVDSKNAAEVISESLGALSLNPNPQNVAQWR